jgi:hypothetical protein
VFSTSQTITLSAPLVLSETASPVTIDGPGAGLVTVSGGGTVGVFEVGSGVTATISDLTIGDGSATDGGGVANGGSLALTGCTISGNSATYGGGLYNAGKATLTGCTISGNSAGGDGGGVVNEASASLTLTDCTISGNVASAAGGYGGGSYGSYGAGTYGGGIANEGVAALASCTISGNSAAGDGAGIANEGSATLALTGCTISGNSAGGDGGGIANESSAALALTGSTISNNSATDAGGLYDAGSATAAVTDTIVAGNTGSSGPSDISGSQAGQVTGTYDLIGTGGSGGLSDGTGNIVLTSLTDLGLAPLGHYGGPTQTMALLPGSAAIGAGAAVSSFTIDERGDPLGSPPDIGAFQVQPASPTLEVLSIYAGTLGSRNTSLSSVEVVLNEPAGSNGFSTGALTLTDNGGPNLITGAVSITLVVTSVVPSAPGWTYDISGLSGLTAAEGSYTLTINAADIADTSGTPGTGSRSVSWLMDTTPPTSTVSALPSQTTSTSFTVSVMATDPKGANGSAPSGVASITIYDSVNGGPFVAFATVSPAHPSATFTGQPGNTYAFYSIATDQAGNVQPTPAAAQTTTTVINTSTPTPTPTPTPAPLVVIGQQPLFQRKLDKKGKPHGKPVLAGFTLDFGVPLSSATASNPANYRVNTMTIKRVKKVVEHILHPITDFTVAYIAASDAVVIEFTGKETFPTGGQMTVLSGVTGALGGAGAPTVFTIAKGGKSITPS